MLKPGELVIDDGTPEGVHSPWGVGKGYDPATVVRGMFAPPSQLQLIPRGEWSDRIKEKVAAKSQLSDLRGDIPSLDQGQVGYCWAHSTTNTVTLSRRVAGEPYVPLSAYAIAATIKKGADEGGWCGLSAQFARDKGIPSQSLWPQGDRNYRVHDTPEVWANAALHKVTEDWVDLAAEVYDQNLTFDQVATCLLLNVPCAVDFNWWSHSVCALDLVDGAAHRNVTRSDSGKLATLAEFEALWGVNNPVTGGIGVRIWNSWGDGWSDRGTGVLTGNKAIPDGAVATRVTGASTN